MPTTRRSGPASTRSRPGPTKGQSTISFHSKVTKSVPKDIKKDPAAAPAIAKIEPTEEAPEEDVDDVEVPELDTTEESKVEEQQQIPEESEVDLKAEKITDAQINKYWKGIEKERRAPRLHQQDLTLSEKVLRYFDVSSQYGPCIGIPRLRRWQRAERLGLAPPIEVLAVLLKEERTGNPGIEVAQMDKILTSTAIGV